MPPVYVIKQRRHYGCAALILDLVMLGITSGLWLIWIIIREWRNR